MRRNANTRFSCLFFDNNYRFYAIAVRSPNSRAYPGVAQSGTDRPFPPGVPCFRCFPSAWTQRIPSFRPPKADKYFHWTGTPPLSRQPSGATICRIGRNLARASHLCQAPANTPECASFPVKTTLSTSSARTAEKSLTPMSSGIWRLRRRPGWPTPLPTPRPRPMRSSRIRASSRPLQGARSGNCGFFYGEAASSPAGPSAPTVKTL